MTSDQRLTQSHSRLHVLRIIEKVLTTRITIADVCMITCLHDSQDVTKRNDEKEHNEKSYHTHTTHVSLMCCIAVLRVRNKFNTYRCCTYSVLYTLNSSHRTALWLLRLSIRHSSFVCHMNLKNPLSDRLVCTFQCKWISPFWAAAWNRRKCSIRSELDFNYEIFTNSRRNQFETMR